MDICLSPARAAASRRNGAKSRGPKTPEGKARSARNALKHGLRAQCFVVLGDEDLDEFDALEAALTAELAPQGMLQAVLVRRIVAATWRLERAERIEAELFAQNIRGTTSFGLALIRDCNNPRAFDTLLRYRGTTLAELWRALRLLKALQAEAAGAVPDRDAPDPAPLRRPDEPKTRAIAGDSRVDAGAIPASPAPGPVGARLAPGAAVGAPDGAARGPNPFPALAPATPSAKTAPAADGASAVRHAPSNACAASAEMPIGPEARTKPGEAAGFDAGGPAAFGLNGGDMVGF
jgi:hypothetical protein